ncbi:hypothetical protein L204_106400 [Cryptococcus depauperatus]
MQHPSGLWEPPIPDPFSSRNAASGSDLGKYSTGPRSSTVPTQRDYSEQNHNGPVQAYPGSWNPSQQPDNLPSQYSVSPRGSSTGLYPRLPPMVWTVPAGSNASLGETQPFSGVATDHLDGYRGLLGTLTKKTVAELNAEYQAGLAKHFAEKLTAEIAEEQRRPFDLPHATQSGTLYNHPGYSHGAPPGPSASGVSGGLSQNYPQGGDNSSYGASSYNPATYQNQGPPGWRG